MSEIEAQSPAGLPASSGASSAAGWAVAVPSLPLIAASRAVSCGCDNAVIAVSNLWKSSSVTAISARVAPETIMLQHHSQTAPFIFLRPVLHHPARHIKPAANPHPRRDGCDGRGLPQVADG